MQAQGGAVQVKDLNVPDVSMKKQPASSSAGAGAGAAAGGEAGPSSRKPSTKSAHDANRRSVRTRTMRVRDGFFDSSLLHYVSLDGSSGAPVPEDALAKERSPKGINHKHHTPVATEDEEDEEDDTPTGPDHQAVIPAWRPRPAKPTAKEAKFLPAGPLYPPVDPVALAEKSGNKKTRAARAGVTGPMPPAGVAASSSDFRYKYRWAKDGPARHKLVEAAVNALDKQLGPNFVKVLGLESMGFKLAQSWQPHEELLFCLGMCDKYRMFKYIRQCYLFSRSAHELNGYYHNVWKTRSTPEADEFLTLREEEASRQEFEEFFDKVRDRLINMWDRKKMGDMPKLVKDMAAAAAAEAAAAPRKERTRQAELNKRAELISSSEEEEEEEEEEVEPEPSDSSTGASIGTADDSDDSRRAARNRQRQRKRPAGSAGRPPVKRPRYPSTQLLMVPRPQFRQQQRRRQQQQQYHAEVVPTPALQRWLHANQPSYQPRQRSTHRGSTSPRYHPSGVQEEMQLPEMPYLHRPDPQDSAAVAAWLKALPDLKAAMSAYVDTVSSMTDSAIQDYQSRIAQLEQQRTNVHAQADAYLQTLLAQGQELLADMTAKQQTHKQQLQMPAVVQQEMLAIAVPQPQQYAQERQPDGQLQQWLEQQQQQQQDGAPAPSGDAVAMAANASGSSRPVSAADAGKPQQQLLGQHGLQPQQDQAPVAKAVAAAAAGKGSSSAGGAACAQQQQEQEEAAARDSHPHQHDQQQAAVLQQAAPLPQAPPQQAPITAEVDMTSPLPFPGGPLNKWLAPRLQGNASTDAVVVKHIPRPYLKRPKLEGGGTPGQD